MIRYIVWVDGEGDIKIVKIAKGNNKNLTNFINVKIH